MSGHRGDEVNWRSPQQQFIFGLEKPAGFFARLIPPNGRENVYQSAVESFLATGLDQQEFSVFWSNYIKDVIGKKNILEAIDLKDYLSRTLATAVEYLFCIVLANRPRNFSLWDKDQWKTFFRELLHLYAPILRNDSRINQGIYDILVELLPEAMYKALKHAVETKLVKVYLFTANVEKETNDFDCALSMGKEKDEDVELAQFIAGLRQKVDSGLTGGFDLLGGTTSFGGEFVMDDFLHQPDLTPMGTTELSQEQAANEIYVKIRKILNILKQKIEALFVIPRLPNIMLRAAVQNFVQSEPQELSTFIRDWAYYLNDCSEPERNNIIMGLTALSQTCEKIVDWPIYTDDLPERKKLISAIGNFLLQMIPPLMVDKVSLSREVRAERFASAVQNLADDPEKISQQILSDEWMYQR